MYLLERRVRLYQISRSNQWPPRQPGGVKSFHRDFIKKTFFSPILFHICYWPKGEGGGGGGGAFGKANMQDSIGHRFARGRGVEILN